ncbi:Sec-independent protein translocase protein TatB [Thalassospira tepidiphila]|uniref:Sec-independent protein translocase protein TatB n=1 Tax=Thalassospira tepidiphila TaxID=393657 RepID=UPI002923F7B6|nr:hypothetical protein MACH01_18120 [Thalassospira tepidiphila]
MFDIGWTEMALVAVVALFVVGPKELPHLLYKLAGYWKKVRGMAREFQSGIDDIIREAELDDLRKQVNSSHSNPTDFLENKISSPKSDGKKTESKPKAEKPAETADTPAAKPAKTTGTPADDSKKKDQPESQA